MVGLFHINSGGAKGTAAVDSVMYSMLLKRTLAFTWLVARDDNAVACDKTKLAVAHLYPPSGCKMNSKSENACCFGYFYKGLYVQNLYTYSYEVLS